MKLIRIASGSLSALALASVFALSAQGAGTGNVPLGSNLAGEACETSGPVSQSASTTITCAGANAATLRMSSLGAPLPAEASAHHAAIVRAALAMRSDEAGPVTCDAGQWFDAMNRGLLVCTQQSNGWPRLIVASVVGNTLYEADGMPSSLPVLQAAVARASGVTVSQEETDATRQAVSARVPGDVLKASSADAASYEQFVQLGRLYGGANNYAGAENAYRHALEIETRLLGPQSVPVGETLAELALQVSNQSRFDEAAALFQRATPIIEGAASPTLRARLASYRALDAANRRQFGEGLTYARSATAARRAEVDAATKDADAGGPPVSKGELAHSLRIEAEMALRLDDLAGARASAEEALWIVTEEPGLPLWWRPQILTLMGQINEREGRVVPAERDYRDAVDLSRRMFGNTSATALAELKLGRFYSGQQVYAPSLTAYRDAFAILARDPVARLQIVPDQIAPYIDAATAQDTTHELDAEIFKASQLTGSDISDQTIARMAARQAAGNPALADLVRNAQNAARSRDNLRIDLAAEYAKPDDERNAARERRLVADLATASGKSDQLAMQVNQSYPDYARLADPGPVSLSDVQSRLNGDEALLTYVIGVNGAYGLLVTQHGFTSKKLAIGADELGAEINELRSAFVPQLGKVSPFSTKSAFVLYGKLLAPFEGQLGGVRHLVVSSAGDLSSLPFALLVTQEPTSASYSDAAWLVKRMALSQVPSPRAFVALRNAEQTRVAARQPFFGVGAPSFSGGGRVDALAASCLDNGPVSADMLRALPPLPETAGEVSSIGQKLGASSNAILTGSAASEANVRGRNLADYGVLYFATHGLLPGELRCQAEPGLALTPASGGVANDGLLTASDIAGLKLNADLVVLSACNTAEGGSGKLGGGALEGLADAFFDAGARAVVASHWQVPSAATVKLMTGMFDRLGANRTAGLAEALRQSQLALIANPTTSHPFNWAAFTLIGDGDTVLATAGLPSGRLADRGR